MNCFLPQPPLLFCCCTAPPPPLLVLLLLLVLQLLLLLCCCAAPFAMLLPRHVYVCIHKSVFFSLIDNCFLFRPRVFLRALGSVAHREPARTPHASLGPGRVPWHVLWGLKEARPLGETFRARRAIQAHANPHVHNTLLTG